MVPKNVMLRNWGTLNYDLSILVLCMNFEQFQMSMWWTLHCQTTQAWWVTSMGCKRSKLWLLCYCFYCCCLVFSSASSNLLLCLNKWFVQIYWNVNFSHHLNFWLLTKTMITIHGQCSQMKTNSKMKQSHNLRWWQHWSQLSFNTWTHQLSIKSSCHFYYYS